MNFDTPIISAFINLAVIVGILGVILLIIKKYGKKINNSKDNKSLNIISKSSLSPKNHLYIIEVENKKLLIGANDNSINLISELDTKQENIGVNNSNNFKNQSNSSINKNTAINDLSFKSFIKNSISKH